MKAYMHNSNIKEKLYGVFAPLVTPFINQEIDYDGLVSNIKKLNGSRLKGYMALGSNGEFKSLTDDESLKVIELIAKNKSFDKTLIAGVGRESAYATIEFIKKVADLGVDFVSILTPNYFPKMMNDQALVKYYWEIADKSRIPIMIYCIPKSANGVVISPEAVSTLAKHPNIVGMKDSSQLDLGNYIDAVKNISDFYVLSGSITKFLDGLTKGAIGGVLSMANYFPNYCCKIQELYDCNMNDKAEKLSELLCDLNRKISSYGSVVSVKAVMNILGYTGGEPRLPLLPMDDIDILDLKNLLNNIENMIKEFNN
ncbi:dihydrodipicolinate synthase family protein [Thermoanaerobacterium thermosaccharolyticum]|uniref:dihydrodipicolinate synthase family protein n=1 Tax=Thermoanaerobacterium thermosaccharolyticum TaxID=1517 RepID=UPI003DA9B211